MASVVCFIIVPFAIYTLSYIPYTSALGRCITAGNLISDMWNNANNMLWYHGNFLRESGHIYQSSWWMMMLDVRPFLYYVRYYETSHAVIGVFSNPLIAIGGLAALYFTLNDFLRTKSKESYVIIVGYLAQLLPWVLITRTMFSYHYFPSVIFLILAICSVFCAIIQRMPEYRWMIYLFSGVAAGVFFMLLPPTVGIQTPDWYSALFVKWLPSWWF